MGTIIMGGGGTSAMASNIAHSIGLAPIKLHINMVSEAHIAGYTDHIDKHHCRFG